jgi:sulfiredoxin
VSSNGYGDAMLKDEKIPIEAVYVPAKRRATLNPQTVDELAAAILEEGLKTPILVRPDGNRFVLIEGLHRLEACRALGEKTILGIRVQARKH